MVNVPAAVAALVAAVLIGFAALAMTGGEFGIAGVSFLSASIVIYLRERFFVAH
ncbi:hypothetical protein ACFPYI_12410 [Halomarina salina]|uniref:Uncharacterized protein n=1 Tax=Halomarina salina TaxID=1872699 RepID=A0ABD5RP88_9EURY|nr:hypothetical protein [Halomarina salina]